MLAVVLVSALAGASPQLQTLEPIAAALERCGVEADRLDHASPPSVENDRRMLVSALADAETAFADAVRIPSTLAGGDARDLALALADARSALANWASARDALDLRAMRAAAHALREAIARAQAVVSAAETASG